MAEETRGRKKKYSADVLREIAIKYIEHQHTGAVTASKLAVFAKELGYDDIQYYHFTRNSEVLKDIIQLDAASGRGQKYTANDLKMIIEKCCESMPNHEKLNVATLVKYAKKLGYKDINTYHFTKIQEVKELIDALGRDSSALLTSDEKEKFALKHANILKADELVDTFKTKPLQLKIILRNFSKNYEDLKLDYLNITAQLRKCTEELSEMQKLKESYKSVSEECKYYKHEYTRISKYDKLNDKLLMLQRLNEMGIKVNLSESSFQALVNSNVRTNDNIEPDDNLQEGQEAHWISDYSTPAVQENVSIEGQNVVPFRKITDQRVQEVDDFLSGFLDD